MSHYVLGLDIGITSVGYGIIDLDTNDFIDYGDSRGSGRSWTGGTFI